MQLSLCAKSWRHTGFITISTSLSSHSKINQKCHSDYIWRHDSNLWKTLESFPSTGSISVVKALLGSFYCPDILGVPSTYFISKVWTLSALTCQSVSATGLLYEMKVILPVGELFIFVQLASARWKDLGVFGQLNNVNLKPINILLQFRLRKIFSTLNKRREQRLFSAEETRLAFSSVKITITMWDPTTWFSGRNVGWRNSNQSPVCSPMFKYLQARQAVSGYVLRQYCFLAVLCYYVRGNYFFL